jgi:hypothetical protein
MTTCRVNLIEGGLRFDGLVVVLFLFFFIFTGGFVDRR